MTTKHAPNNPTTPATESSFGVRTLTIITRWMPEIELARSVGFYGYFALEKASQRPPPIRKLPLKRDSSLILPAVSMRPARPAASA